MAMPDAVWWIGFFVLCWWGFLFLRWMYLHCLRSRCCGSTTKYQHGNSWALVTGANDGIGKGFCQELARDGFHVALLALSHEKLAAVAKQLTADFHVQTRIVVADAARANEPALWEEIRKQIGDIELSILINNVGVSLPLSRTLEEHDHKDIDWLITVNCMFPTKLTNMLMPTLMRRPRSAIINVSSVSCSMPVPFITVYGATKAYNLAFSVCLAAEVKQRNVDVLCITPGFVASQLTRTDKTTLKRCSPNVAARGSLNKLGVWGLRQSEPYWFHSLLVIITNLLPTTMVEQASWDEMIGLIKEEKAALEEKKKQGSDKKHKQA